MPNPMPLTRRQIVAPIATFSLASLLRASEPKILVPSYNTFTDQEEVELGEAFDKKMQSEAKFVTDGLISDYLNDIVHRLGLASRRPNLPYFARIIDVAVVNANAVPGGIVYVNRGLLDLVRQEDELSAALAHEVGHVAAHHGTNKLAAIFIGKSFYELVKREVLHDQAIVAGVIEKLGGALFLLAQLQYSRTNESEADLLGYYNMLRGGWDPDGMVALLQLLLSHSGDPNFVEAIFSDHPPTSERIQAIQRELRQAPPSAGLIRDAPRFHQMKEMLAQLPPPRMKGMPR